MLRHFGQKGSNFGYCGQPATDMPDDPVQAEAFAKQLHMVDCMRCGQIQGTKTDFISGVKADPTSSTKKIKIQVPDDLVQMQETDDIVAEAVSYMDIRVKQRVGFK